jgi:hypothetical protein
MAAQMLIGNKFFEVGRPQGGWYAPLRIRRDFFGDRARTGVDAQAILLYYGVSNPATGIALLPGELFGHPSNANWHTLRGHGRGRHRHSHPTRLPAPRCR